jgi:Protein of unknown function DUF262
MTLKEEVEKQRAEIRSDSYPMSIGELMSLYKEGDIDLHPDFQRQFKWTHFQKSSLIESLLVGIPIPSIFVSQRNDGKWDIIDGLQRLSTIFEFFGCLKDENGDLIPKSKLVETRLLPSLKDKTVDTLDEDPEEKTQQINLKRAKISIQILLKESRTETKYELFQRVNSGGTSLNQQEIRNSLMIMKDKHKFHILNNLRNDENFLSVCQFTEKEDRDDYDLELIVRFFVFRKDEHFKNISDIGTFLNNGILKVFENTSDFEESVKAFKKTFSILYELGEDVLKKYHVDKDIFKGSFITSAFEAIAIGIGYNPANIAEPFKREKIIELWNHKEFINAISKNNTPASRIPKIIRLGRNIFTKLEE